MVQAALDVLAGLLNDVAEAAEELQKRLEPVLRQEPLPGGPECKDIPGPPCRLASDVRDMAGQTRGVLDRLKRVLSLLEV